MHIIYLLALHWSQVLRRKERECEHEMERLAREKIAAQQRLAALKREVTSVRASSVRPRSIGTCRYLLRSYEILVRCDPVV